jgi:DNA polymerase
VTFATAYNINIDKLADRARETLPPAIVEESTKGWDWALEQERDTRGLSRDTWIGIDAIKRAWRMAHPKISRFWGDLEDAARAAIENPGDEYQAGRVTFIRNAAWLMMRLPSDRCLCYPAATNGEEAITFMGTNQFTRRFERMPTYGGKLAENATQAVARDILAHGLVLAEERGFEPVMHVHDEIIAENCTAAELSEVMSIAPAWADGLPLAAKGFDCARYRK